MRKIIQQEVPHVIGIGTLAIVTFMVGAIVWLGDQQMNKEIDTREGKVLYNNL